MSKTLSTIQKLARLGRVLSRIICVCCIVGGIGCLVGITTLIGLSHSTVQIGGLTIHELIEKNAELSMGTLYTTMTVGMILCLFESILARYARCFFDCELSAGTPFDTEVADRLFRLGVRAIVLPLIGIILAAVAYAVMNHYFADVCDMHLDNFTSVGLGLGFMVVSLLCRLGAEQAETTR